MYDSIILKNNKDLMDLYADDKMIKSILKDSGQPYSEHTGGYDGKYKNFYISKKDDTLFFKGSLAKLYYGNNIKHLHWSDASKAIDILSSKFRMPLHEAFLSRIDVGFNLPTKENVRNYLLCLDYARGYSQNRYYRPNGKYFLQSEKVMAFYDKIRESKQGTWADDQESKSRNLLRYELRLFNPCRQLGIKGGIQANQLSKPAFADQLLSHWVNEYFRIAKNRALLIPCNIQSQRDLSNFISLAGSKAIGGESAIYKLIDSLTLRNSCHPQKIRGDMYRSVEKLHSDLRYIKSEELESELDQLIMFIGMQNRL
jgi:hypothetical protein